MKDRRKWSDWWRQQCKNNAGMEENEKKTESGASVEAGITQDIHRKEEENMHVHSFTCIMCYCQGKVFPISYQQFTVNLVVGF